LTLHKVIDCNSPLSRRHKPPIGSTSRRPPVSLVAAPIFRQAAASRFLEEEEEEWLIWYCSQRLD